MKNAKPAGGRAPVRPATLAAVAAVAAVAALAALAGCGRPPDAPAATVPVPVQTERVQPRALEMSAELPGRIEAVRVAEVRARVAGIVLQRHFQEGSDVRAGQLLFTIDPAPFQVALARAQAAAASAEAARVETAAVLQRYRALATADAISRQDADAAHAAHQRALAASATARADIQTARLNLQHASVKAPIAGRIGRALVTEGALVGQNEATALASIQQIDPVYADFTQPVADAVRLREAAQAGVVSLDAGSVALPISLAVEGSRQRRAGRLLFSGSAVDRSSGQVSLRGEFPNHDGLLLPGMYVRVRIRQGTDPQAILVPQRAVGRSTDGRPQVLVVGEGGRAEERLVETGAMVGTDWQLRAGLQAGDRLIVGRGSARPGDRVVETAATARP